LRLKGFATHKRSSLFVRNKSDKEKQILQPLQQVQHVTASPMKCPPVPAAVTAVTAATAAAADKSAATPPLIPPDENGTPSKEPSQPVPDRRAILNAKGAPPPPPPRTRCQLNKHFCP
jgi:hypothetical protein